MKVELVGIKAWYACRDIEHPYLIIERMLDIPESVYEYWEEKEEPLDPEEEEEEGEGEKGALGGTAAKKVNWEDKIVPDMDHLDCGNTESVIVFRSESFPNDLQIEFPKITMKT